MRPSHIRHPQHGFTLVELLVVISIIVLLAGLLVPAVGMVNAMAKRSADGKSIGQLYACAKAYAMNNDGAYPAYGNPVDAQKSQELLLWSTSDLVPKNFKSASKSGMPATGTQDNPSWTTTNGSHFSYDPSVPADPGANRPVMGNLPISSTKLNATVHSTNCMIVCGDGHTETLNSKKARPTGCAKNEGFWMPDKNTPTIPDYIFDSDGDLEDGVDVTVAGQGSTTRGYLRGW